MLASFAPPETGAVKMKAGEALPAVSSNVFADGHSVPVESFPAKSRATTFILKPVPRRPPGIFHAKVRVPVRNPVSVPMRCQLVSPGS